jgi:hypothetical protein
VVAFQPPSATHLLHLLLSNPKPDTSKTGIHERLALMAESAGKIRMWKIIYQSQRLSNLSAWIPMSEWPIKVCGVCLSLFDSKIDPALFG